MPFRIPESYHAYCTDAAVRTAVDHILYSKPLRVPADFEWCKLPEFHRAVLSAHQVRCEFAIFLHELWDAIWRPALEECDLVREFELQKVADAESWNDGQKLDTYAIWESGRLDGVLGIPDTRYDLSLGTFANLERVMLSFYLWDRKNKEELTTTLDLGNHWPHEDIDDTSYAWSSGALAKIAANGDIDLAPLRQAAADALAAVERFCQPD